MKQKVNAIDGERWRKVIDEIQIETGWTQQEISTRTGIPLSTINRWKSGTAAPLYGAGAKITALHEAAVTHQIEL